MMKIKMMSLDMNHHHHQRSTATTTMSSSSSSSSLIVIVSVFLFLLLLPIPTTKGDIDSSHSYGTDISFPMHQDHVSTNYDWLPHNTLPTLYTTPEGYVTMPIQPLGNRQELYSEYIRSCIEHYDMHGRKCLDSERERVNMNKRQPQSMVNYTLQGYYKTRAPDDVWKSISDFWVRNKEQWVLEQWPTGNTYTNHWNSPSYLVSVEDENLRGGGGSLKTSIWKATKDAVEQWTQQEMSPISLYGIRIYTDGSILAPHVDKLPLVTSVIFNIAQDVNDHWPLEVIGHDGLAHNITLEPGEMLLYESHSIIHGRPFPLKGKYMANVFVHFEPTGHSYKHHNMIHDQTGTNLQYRDALEHGAGGHEAVEHPKELSSSEGGDELPIYILPDSPEVKHYRKMQEKQKKQKEKDAAAAAAAAQAGGSGGVEKPKTTPTTTTGGGGGEITTNAHALARDGKVEELYLLLEDGGDHLVHAKDTNGWQPLHESARAGHLTVVQLLVAKGASINERTHSGDGGTPLYYASNTHGEESLVAKFLQSHGAVIIPPDTEEL